MEKMSREELVEEIEQYAEAAGFNDYGKEKLASLSLEELKNLHKDIFSDNKVDELPF